jgi:hypothetical protein
MNTPHRAEILAHRLKQQFAADGSEAKSKEVSKIERAWRGTEIQRLIARSSAVRGFPALA